MHMPNNIAQRQNYTSIHDESYQKMAQAAAAESPANHVQGYGEYPPAVACVSPLDHFYEFRNGHHAVSATSVTKATPQMPRITRKIGRRLHCPRPHHRGMGNATSQAPQVQGHSTRSSTSRPSPSLYGQTMSRAASTTQSPRRALSFRVGHGTHPRDESPRRAWS